MSHNTKVTGPITVALMVLAMAGCATHPLPDVEQALAEAQIREAKLNHAYQHATLYINAAEEKLELAKQKIQEKENQAAKKLLDQSLKDAEAALAISQAEQTKQLLDEVQSAIKALKERTHEQS